LQDYLIEQSEGLLKIHNETDPHDLAKNLKKMDNADKELGRGAAPVFTHLRG